jgi:hypothetical protein
MPEARRKRQVAKSQRVIGDDLSSMTRMNRDLTMITTSREEEATEAPTAEEATISRSEGEMTEAEATGTSTEGIETSLTIQSISNSNSMKVKKVKREKILKGGRNSR